MGVADAGAYKSQAAHLSGADRLAVNGYTTTVDVIPGQTYSIRVADDVCRSVAALTSSGMSPVSGTVHVSTYIDNTVQTYNGARYVQRHYEIVPDNGASAATAHVTLYFTQEEFTAYNTSLGREELPAAYNDYTDNPRVFQYHGTPKAGQTGPGAYAGAPTVITPDLSWNYGLGRWEVSFSVTGFSGFFVGSASSPLPVKLVRFEGKLVESNSILLQWNVTEQVDMADYVVEHSDDGRNFTVIGTIPANESSQSRYEFIDHRSHSAAIAYYRLKMTEQDGSYAYSRILRVVLPDNESKVIVYPVPTRDFVWVQGAGIRGTSLKVVNIRGVVLNLVTATPDTQRVDISPLPAGVYFISNQLGNALKFVKE